MRPLDEPVRRHRELLLHGDASPPPLREVCGEWLREERVRRRALTRLG